MKIHQLVAGYVVPVTNEENDFIERHGDSVKITALDEHDQWLAQNIVRKGLYKINNDNVTLVKKSNE